MRTCGSAFSIDSCLEPCHAECPSPSSPTTLAKFTVIAFGAGDDCVPTE